jgi:hypothetical protein
MRIVSLLVLLVICVAGQRAIGEEPDVQSKKASDKLKAFEYPGSSSLRSNNTGDIAQAILVTEDSLEKVAKWYYKAFSIDEGYWDGVANIPWPAGVKATEAKGQQQWAIFRDDIRPKNDGSGNKAVRDGTTRSFVVRTPEHTLFVTLNRTPADKLTLISVVYLSDDKLKNGPTKK